MTPKNQFSFGVKSISKFSWGLEAYIKNCLWVLLTHVYWFRATGGYICGCGRPSNLVVNVWRELKMYLYLFFLLCIHVYLHVHEILPGLWSSNITNIPKNFFKKGDLLTCILLSYRFHSHHYSLLLLNTTPQIKFHFKVSTEYTHLSCLL